MDKVDHSLLIFCKKECSNFQSSTLNPNSLVMAATDATGGHRAEMVAALPTLNPLILLLHIETLDGSALPEKFLTIPNCHDLSIECREEKPYKVELLSTYEACLTYKENVIIVDLAIKLIAVEMWIGLPVVITAVIMSRDKVDQIILVRKQSRIEKETRANARLAAMQEEQDVIRNKLNQVSDKETKLMEDITSYVIKQGDLAKIVYHLTEQIRSLES